MSRVFVLCNVYNEAATLPRMAESVKAHFPDCAFVFVDGRYPDFPGTTDYSVDATERIARRYGTYLAVHDYECEKRNAGLRYIDGVASDGDFVPYLDADETITGFTTWPTRVGRFTFTRKTRHPVLYDRCRLYKWEPGLEFKHRHYDLYSASGELIAWLDGAPHYHVVGTGDHYEKPRTQEKQAYFRALRQREGHPSEELMNAG